MVKGISLSVVLLTILASVAVLGGCASDDSGPDNATAIAEAKKKGLVNMDPNQPGALQPRDMVGNPIGGAGGTKGGAGKLAKPTGAPPPKGGAGDAGAGSGGAQ